MNIGTRARVSLGILFLLSTLFLSCEADRPKGGNPVGTLSGSTILHSATIEAWKAEQLLYTVTADETGRFTIPNFSAVGAVTLKACKGEFLSAAVTQPVAYSGCLEKKLFVNAAADLTGHHIDFLSTFTAHYAPDTSAAEWSAYLSVAALGAGSLDTSLTDATKLHLYQQALSFLAKAISEANSISPETSCSTENLFTLLLADLDDDQIINGSPATFFCTHLPVGEELLRVTLLPYLATVSPDYTETDLADWDRHLSLTPAKFLAGGEQDDSDFLSDEETDGDSLYPDHDTVGNPPALEIVTPANNSTLFATITIKAQRTLDSCPLISLTCTVKNADATFTKELVDTNPNPEVFVATLDTRALELTDGSYTLTCTASNGLKQAVKSLKFTLANHNEVRIEPYIFDKVTGATVDIFDLAGVKQASLQEEAGLLRVELAPGEYIVKLTAGSYTSLLLKEDTGEPKTLALSTVLLSRGVVEAGATTTIYVTPLTTIREIIYQALVEKGSSPDTAKTRSLELLRVHYDETLNPYSRPQAGQPGENVTTHYMAIAALESLARDIATVKNLTPGSVVLDNLLATLGADLIDGAALFNGLDGTANPLTLKGFPIDSYLYRYHYAVSLKKLIEEDRDGHGWSLSDFQSLIHTISTDTSELFPSNKPPKEVVSTPPTITNLKYRRGAMTVPIEYHDPTNIPYVNTELDILFDLTFTDPAVMASLLLSLDTTTLANADTLTLSGDTYTAAGLVIPGADGEKTLTIAAEDDQGNRALTGLRLIKDTSSPTLTLTPPADQILKRTFSFDYASTDTNLESTWYTLNNGTTTTDHNLPSPAGQTELTVPADGSYTVTLNARDKAENENSAAFTRTIDGAAPLATIGVKNYPAQDTTLQNNTWVAFDDLILLYSGVSDRPGAVLTYHYLLDGSTEAISSPTTELTHSELFQNITETLNADPGTNHRLQAWVEDEPGNESPKLDITFKVDAVPPTLTTTYIPDVTLDTTVNYVHVGYKPTDNNLQRVYYKIDQGLSTDLEVVSGVEKSFTVSCVSGADFILSESGTYTISVYAEDFINQTKLSRAFQFDCSSPLLDPTPFNNTKPDPYVNSLTSLELNLGGSDDGKPFTYHWETYSVLNSIETKELPYSGSLTTTDTTITVDLTNLPDGTYHFKYWLSDTVGNTTTMTEHTFTVDNTPPLFDADSVAITGDPAPTFPLYKQPQYYTGKKLWVPVDEKHLASCTVSDSEVTITPDTLTPERATIELDYALFDTIMLAADTTLNVIFRCYDKAGNFADSPNFTSVSDATPPTLTLIAQPPAKATTPTFTLQAQIGNDTIAPKNKVYCKYIRNGLSEYTDCPGSPKLPDTSNTVSYTINSEGVESSYTATLYVDDIAGNTGANYQSGTSPHKTASWLYDNTAPRLSAFGVGSVTRTTAVSYTVRPTDTPINEVSGMYAYARSTSGAVTKTGSCSLGYLAITGIHCEGSPFPLCTLITETKTDAFTCSFSALSNDFSGQVYFRATDVYGNGTTSFADLSPCNFAATTDCLKRDLTVDATFPEARLQVDRTTVNETMDLRLFPSATNNPDTLTCSIARTIYSGGLLQIVNVPGTVKNCTGQTTFTYTAADLSGLTTGIYFAKVVATKNGIGSAADHVQFLYDNTPPQIQNTSFVWYPNTPNNYYNVEKLLGYQVKAVDDNAITKVRVYLLNRSVRQADGSVSTYTGEYLVAAAADLKTAQYLHYLTAPLPVDTPGGEYYQFKLVVEDNANHTVEKLFSVTPNSTYGLRIREKNEPETHLDTIGEIAGGAKQRFTIHRMKLDTYDTYVTSHQLALVPSRVGSLYLEWGHYMWDTDCWKEQGAEYCRVTHMLCDDNTIYLGSMLGQTGPDILKANLSKKVPVAYEVVDAKTFDLLVPGFKNIYSNCDPLTGACEKDTRTYHYFPYPLDSGEVTLRYRDNFGKITDNGMVNYESFNCNIPHLP